MAGTLLALGAVVLPLGTLWRVAETGAAPAQAWKTGLLFAFACAVLHAWIFTGAWV
jgi:hypothetical protein